jgi:signal transduction histidine kinase
MTRSLQRRTRDAFVLVLLVPVMLGGLGVWTADRYRRNIDWVSHTKEVLAVINQVLLSVTTAESSQRGLLLTSEHPYLDSYRSAREKIPAEMSQLRRLVGDNPAQRQNIRQLSPLVAARLREMDQLVAQWQAGQRAINPANSVMESGTVSMARIRGLCALMESEESQLLADRVGAQQSAEIEVGLSFGFGILINVALLYWAYQLIKRYGLARDTAEDEIRQLNKNLEKRVQERTADLESANENLRRSNDDLTSFAYVASHDLQEPLRTVGSFAGLLKRRYEGKLDPKADDYIQFMVDGTRRMQTLVQDLLAYAQIGTQSLHLVPVSMQSVVDQAKVNLESALAERKGQIISEELPTVDGDEGKLTLVFQNLMGNALKFSKPSEPPVIRIAARREAKEWLFSVADNGIGFDPAYAEKVFAMFQRLHQVGTYKGTGIGLAICKRIIEGHGGRIWATSEPSVGSTFFFTLPVSQGTPSPKI